MVAPALLTVAEAALRACVSEAMIRRWIAEGTLACYRLGARGKRGHIRIAVEDLDGAMASFRVQGKPEPVKAPARVQLNHLKLKPS